MTRFLVLAGLGLALAGSAHAAKVRIGFVESAYPVVDKTSSFTGLQAEAARAFVARYGAENGYLALTTGADSAMIAVVTYHKKYTRAIWTKMLRNGDASVEGGIGYFHFKATNEVLTSYYYMGTIHELGQGGTGYLHFLRPGTLKLYMVEVHQDCSVADSVIIKLDPDTKVKATELTRTEKVGNKFRYHYSVNGGLGTKVTAIRLTYGGGGFIETYCDASIYQERTGDSGEAAASPVPRP